MVDLLMDQGMVDITRAERQTKNTILHHLAKSSKEYSSSLFRYYLAFGLNPHEKNSEGQTALDVLLYRTFDDETCKKTVCLLEYLNKDCSVFSEKEQSEATRDKLRGVGRLLRQSLKNSAQYCIV